jgi:hypothetical protein
MFQSGLTFTGRHGVVAQKINTSRKVTYLCVARERVVVSLFPVTRPDLTPSRTASFVIRASDLPLPR